MSNWSWAFIAAGSWIALWSIPVIILVWHDRREDRRR